jgi:methionyl-tRNA formyltransferase
VLDALAERGAALIAGVVDDIASGGAHALPQTGEPTLAPKLTLADGALDLEDPPTRSSIAIAARRPNRAPTSSSMGNASRCSRRCGPDEPLDPGAFAAVGRDILLGTGGDAPRENGPARGKGPMAAADWWRGLRGGTPRAELGAQRR